MSWDNFLTGQEERKRVTGIRGISRLVLFTDTKDREELLSKETRLGLSFGFFFFLKVSLRVYLVPMHDAIAAVSIVGTGQEKRTFLEMEGGKLFLLRRDVS